MLRAKHIVVILLATAVTALAQEEKESDTCAVCHEHPDVGGHHARAQTAGARLTGHMEVHGHV